MFALRFFQILPLAFLISARVWAAVEAAIPFDPGEELWPEPGKEYQLTIKPGKGAKPVHIVFTAGTEIEGENRGKPWSLIDRAFLAGVGDLPICIDGRPRVEIADYDGDGYQDFRMLTDHGSGGSSYAYYRYNGKKYVPWEEPTSLGINRIDPAKHLAIASGRAGPCWRRNTYRIQGTHFILIEREAYDEARELRPLVPTTVPDTHYVQVIEKIEREKIAHRKIIEMNPWENEGEEKIIFDQAVSEDLASQRTR